MQDSKEKNYKWGWTREEGVDTQIERNSKRKWKKSGSGGIRTHAIEMTGALNQRLRPLGHATNWLVVDKITALIVFV